MSVMPGPFSLEIILACALVHIMGSTVKNLIVVILVVTLAGMAQHVQISLMALLIVSTALVHLAMMESCVVTILMNVHQIHVKMVDFVWTTSILTHVFANQNLNVITVSVLFQTLVHQGHVKMEEHAKGQEKKEKTTPAFVSQILQDETALRTLLHHHHSSLHH